MKTSTRACFAVWLIFATGEPNLLADQPESARAASEEAEPTGATAEAVMETLPPESEVLAHLPKGRKLPLNATLYVPPKPKKIVLPVYPFELLRKKIAGEAKVSCVVGVDGRVKSTRILSATRPEFGAALAAAIEAMEFGYATVEGEPVATVLGYRHTFRPNPRERMEPRVSAVLAEEWHAMEFINRPKRLGFAAQLDRPIQPKNQPAPAYPTAMLDRRANGEATIEFLLDEKGRPRLPRIVQATDPAFGYAAAQAISAWEFDPPTRSGAPTVMRVAAPFRFQTR